MSTKESLARWSRRGSGDDSSTDRRKSCKGFFGKEDTSSTTGLIPETIHGFGHIQHGRPKTSFRPFTFNGGTMIHGKVGTDQGPRTSDLHHCGRRLILLLIVVVGGGVSGDSGGGYFRRNIDASGVQDLTGGEGPALVGTFQQSQQPQRQAQSMRMDKPHYCCCCSSSSSSSSSCCC